MSEPTIDQVCAICGSTFHTSDVTVATCSSCVKLPDAQASLQAKPTDSVRNDASATGTSTGGERRRFGSPFRTVRELEKRPPYVPPANKSAPSAAPTAKTPSKPATGAARPTTKTVAPKNAPAHAQAAPAAPAPAKTRATELTPVLREKLIALYEAQYANSEERLRTIIRKLADQLHAEPKPVSEVINELRFPRQSLTPQQREQAIALYRGYVERSERPPEGRRRAIAEQLGLSLTKVRHAIHQWAQQQHAHNAARQPTRVQLFEIEKLYWAELTAQRLPYQEIATHIAQQVTAVSSYQVMRWLDMLHDDEQQLASVPAVEASTAARIHQLYHEYLQGTQPPPIGLHQHFANLLAAEQIVGITPKQVHKTLQTYRAARRAAYPANVTVS